MRSYLILFLLLGTFIGLVASIISKGSRDKTSHSEANSYSEFRRGKGKNSKKGKKLETQKVDRRPAPFSEYIIKAKKEKPTINIDYGRSGGRGNSRPDSDCDRVIPLPSHIRSSMRLNHFYRRYTHAYGIPIISSVQVSDAALKRACYVVKFLFADRKDIRDKFHSYYGRAGVIGVNEQTTNIPEHSFLPKWWDTRARGLGATPQIPISTGGEENLLCRPNDRYHNQDIFMHEFAHGVHLVGAELAISGFKRTLDSAFRYARSRGLWSRTYAITDYREYFAQGVNSYFNTQAFSNPPNGIHNQVNTRAKLREYDRTLYGILKDIFPCMNTVLDRCSKGKVPPTMRMNCDGKGPQTQAPPPTTQPPRPPTKCFDVWSLDWCTWQNKWACSHECSRKYCRKSCGLCLQPCIDKNGSCSYWARIGECQRNPGWMLDNCKKSCRKC